MNLTWLRKTIRMDSDNYASMNTHQEREAKERLERLGRARNRIRKLAEMINVSGITITPALTIGPKKDWRTETKRELRAIVRADICKEYENILRLQEPERAARRFLEALADTLSNSHLIE